MAVIMTVMTMMVSIPLAGLGFDVGVLYMIRGKLYQAVDAAALAGARSLGQGGDAQTQKANAQAEAAKFFNANFPPNYWGTSHINFPTPAIDDTTVPNYRTVSATATVSAPLYFLRILGQDTAVIAASSQAGRRDALVMIVLDRSGSMNNPFQGTTACAIMKQDAAQFVSNFAAGRDMVGLVIFGASSFVYPPTTTFSTPDAKGDTVASLIGQIACGGNTNTSGGVQEAYNQIKTVNAKSRANVIVLMTDGRPNGFVADYTGLRQKPGSCDPGGNPLVGVIAQWAGGPKPSGTTAGVMAYKNNVASTSNEVVTANANGCQMAANLANMRNDLKGVPAQDYFNNSVTGPYSQDNPNFPYQNTAPDLSQAGLSVPKNLVILGTNALDNEGTAIRSDKTLKPAIYTIALEGNDPNDPPDTILLRKLANDPTMENDSDPTTKAFWASQNPGQTRGYFVDSPDPSQLCAAFNSIATQIVVRLSK